MNEIIDTTNMTRRPLRVIPCGGRLIGTHMRANGWRTLFVALDRYEERPPAMMIRTITPDGSVGSTFLIPVDGLEDIERTIAVVRERAALTNPDR